MNEIRVFPGIAIEYMRTRLDLSLVRMEGESHEDYLKRCQEVVNLALSFVPKSKPEVWDMNDTTKFRKVGENSYELITEYHKE